MPRQEAPMSGEPCLANKIGDHVAGLRYDDLPPAVVERIKYVALDTIGVAIYGSEMPWAQAVYKFAMDQGGTPESVIVRYGDRTSCTHAAFVNGTVAHSHDFDDDY